MKELIEEGNLKEALINSLYKDIAILDSEMRQIPQLKNTISLNGSAIDTLNEIIIKLECKLSNLKYQVSMNIC